MKPYYSVERTDEGTDAFWLCENLLALDGQPMKRPVYRLSTAFDPWELEKVITKGRQQVAREESL